MQHTFLALLGAFCLVSFSYKSVQEPSAATAVPPVAQPASNPAAHPSAQQGLLLCLQVLAETTTGMDYEILSVGSEVVEGVKGAEATVQVQLDLRMHAEGGAAAETAVQELKKALAKRVTVPAVEAVDYSQTVDYFIQASWNTDGIASQKNSGTHRETLHITMPAWALRTRGATTDQDEAPTEDITSGMSRYIRSLAAKRNVYLGAIRIRPSRETVLSGTRLDWQIRPKPPTNNPDTSSSFQPTQFANFLYLLEAESQHTIVRKISIGKVHKNKIEQLEVELSVYLNDAK